MIVFPILKNKLCDWRMFISDYESTKTSPACLLGCPLLCNKQTLSGFKGIEKFALNSTSAKIPKRLILKWAHWAVIVFVERLTEVCSAQIVW